MSLAIDTLRNEHARILRAVDVTFKLATRVEHGEIVDAADLETLLQFLTFVVHRSHRDKEEECLFPALRAKGIHDGPGCVGVLLNEHEESAQAFQRMVDAAQAYRDGHRLAGGEWAQAASQYAEALRYHIHREEDVLFRNAERLLTQADLQALAVEFARIDEQARRSGIEEVEQRFDELARQSGVRQAAL